MENKIKTEERLDQELEENIKKVLNIFSTFDTSDYEKNFFNSSKEMIKLFFRNLMEKAEGSGCCSDKASFITNKILKSLESQTDFSLSEGYDIKKHPQMKDSEKEIAYWCPETLKNTKEAKYVLYRFLKLDTFPLKKYFEGKLDTIVYIPESDNYKEQFTSSNEIIKMFFTTLMNKKEGIKYSKEKSVYITNKILESLEKKVQLSFEVNSSQCPNTLETTEEAKNIFYNYLKLNLEPLQEYLKK